MKGKNNPKLFKTLFFVALALVIAGLCCFIGLSTCFIGGFPYSNRGQYTILFALVGSGLILSVSGIALMLSSLFFSIHKKQKSDQITVFCPDCGKKILIDVDLFEHKSEN